MKFKKTTLRVILCLVFSIFVCKPDVFSQANDYVCCIRNITQTSPTQIEFDVILEWNGTNSAKLTFLQAGINFNYSALANGGTITGAYKPGSADPSITAAQQFPNWKVDASSKQIRLLAAIATPSSTATIIPPSPGFRVGTFVMTNTVPFSSATPTFFWSFAPGSVTTTTTLLGVYLNGSTTGTSSVTNPSSHCVGSITPNCPTAYAGGPYTSCGDVQLNGSITNATTGTWTSTGSGTFDPNNTTLNAIYHPSAADISNGSVFFSLTTNAGASGCTAAVSNSSATFPSIDDGFACTVDGCDQSTGQATHQAVDCCPAIVTEPNISSCGNIQLHATIYFSGNRTWTSSGTGTFHSVAFNPDPEYRPSAADLNDGSVTLTLSTNNGNPNCSTVTTNVLLTFTSIDDGNPCTIDGCNTGTGQATHQPGNCPDVYNYNACVRNITQTSPTSMQFDVYMEWTGTAAAKLAFLQGGINFNYAGIANGGTITGNFVAGSADPSLPPSQQVPNWNLNALSKQIRLIAAIATPHNIAAPIPTPPGFRVGTFVLNNTVPFTPSSTPNFTWSFVSGSSSTTQLNVSAYLNGATTASSITIPANHCVQSNPVLNACLNANLDDGDPCTDDACDPLTGTVTHTFNGPVVSVTAGAIACYGGSTCVTISSTGGLPPNVGDGVICDYPAGSYTFSVTDSRGCNGTSSVNIPEPPKLTLAVSSTPSSGSDGTATVVPSGGTSPYSYNWSPGGQSNPTATDLAPGNYCVTVIDLNGCSATYCITVASTCNLNPAGPITGPTGVCKKQTGVVYCVAPVPTATSYTWILPSGVTVTGASNLACITLKFTSKYKGGFICVKANTPCGQTASSCLNVVLITKKPATPGSISGPLSLCPNETATYSVAPVGGASSYQWGTNGNLTILSGQGTNSVTVKALANFNNGSVKVKASNCAGTSGNRNKNVSKTAGCRMAGELSGHTQTINENLADWIAYPNPTSGKTMISFNSNKDDNYVFKVMDLIGKVIYTEKLNVIAGFNSIEINLNEYNEGLYIVSVQTEKELIKTIRIVKEE